MFCVLGHLDRGAVFMMVELVAAGLAGEEKPVAHEATVRAVRKRFLPNRGYPHMDPIGGTTGPS